MRVTSQEFKRVASHKLADPKVQKALANAKGRFVVARARSILELDNFEEIRDAAAAIRDHALEYLDLYLEQWEARAAAAGTVVHWAETPEQVNRIVLDIAQRNAVRKVIKSKSMLGEETGLNEYLERGGLEVVETDLGEYIIQQAGDHPSHIIAPAIHKSRDEIADLFAQKHRRARLTEIPALTHEAREILRPHFLTADMGITGANFLIAETGSTMIVTNEGNGRMTTTLPRVHVAIAGIEKIIPTLEDVSLILRLLTRSATGQSISNYLSFTSGPKRPRDKDGPEQFHVVVVDVGRSRVLGSELREALRCIRCGACMNHCPVYQNIGGHPYGWVYPGPIGSVLTPAYVGLEKALDLPNAATLCNQCGVACPVKIPLPDLMRKLREKQFERRLRPAAERWALKAWAWTAARPALYGWLTAIAARLGRWAGGRERLLHRLPFAGAEWTRERDLPAPKGVTFREIYDAQRKRRQQRPD
ncbi:MAG TPA: LutB/LldF family L-lactate oxidation iron-sulfur protein [Burkholderiales bacterium]|jgi:L-lactate dehydrogenase complex protein LldF|nr:LutB/LldF family L-lactate oxidation iron-sulfur protein [Burkholderiales bacterium]